jgi:hypothetical protein
MASAVPSARVLVSQSRYWPAGQDSWSLPDALEDSAYVQGVNIANRGGLPQTRPGTRSLYCLPDGVRQGFTVFTPANGVAHQVIAIAGSVYVSPAPFKVYRQLPGIQFSQSSKFLCFCEAQKSTDYDGAGDPVPLDIPRKVLVMQDGLTRAAFWDGFESRHLNPIATGSEDPTEEGMDETKIGLWMAFSGGRLWVARGNKLFGSDLGNPLKFKESQYLNELPFFPLDGECTGMISLPDQSGLLVFTNHQADLIQSSIQDRTLWSSTKDFQRQILSIGCIAPRSIVAQHGFIYFFSPAGLMSLNDALRMNQTSELIPLDQEMAWSKAYIGPDLEGICCVAHENYLLVSVPHCSLHNTHTWAMDLAVFEDGGRSWNAVWTGWRPVQWATGVVSGRSRAFFLSYDYDTHNRVWEAFLGDRTDNGCPITCSVQFRMDPVQSRERKLFTHAEIDCGQIYGNVSVMAAVAGWRGWFDRILTKEIVASSGRIRLDQTYGDGTTYPKLGGNRPQVRTIRTTDWPNPSECNECGVESEDPNNLDTHFQLFVAWSGRMGVQGVRLYATESTANKNSGCEKTETGFKTLMGIGCASTEEFPEVERPFPILTGTASDSASDINEVADAIQVSTCAHSQISQADADRKAACFARRQVARIRETPNLGSFTFSEGCTTVIVNGPTGVLEVYLEDGVTLASTVDFGQLAHDSAGVDVTLVLKNIGTDILNLGAIQLNAPGFDLITGPSVPSLDPDETTTIIIRATVV